MTALPTALPRPVGTGPLHAHLSDLAEALEPVEQGLVTGRGRLEGFGAEQASHRVECGGNGDIEVSVDATCHGAHRFYDVHCHPFLP